MSRTTQPRRRWTDETIEQELRVQQAAFGRFPTRAELVSKGLRGLWDAAARMGGIDGWRARLAAGTASPVEDASPITIMDQRDQVAEAAYYRWLNGTGGDEVAHWLEAERELAAGSRS